MRRFRIFSLAGAAAAAALDKKNAKPAITFQLIYTLLIPAINTTAMFKHRLEVIIANFRLVLRAGFLPRTAAAISKVYIIIAVPGSIMISIREESDTPNSMQNEITPDNAVSGAKTAWHRDTATIRSDACPRKDEKYGGVCFW